MNFFRKLFGSKPAPSKNSAPAESALPAEATKNLPSAAQPAPAATPPPTLTPAPAGTPASEVVRVHDAYGREIQVTKAHWREAVLLGHLEKVKDQPDALAAVIVQSLRDGFAADLLPYAAHLATTDANSERGHVLHAVTLLELKNPTEAETVLSGFISKHGETGVTLANLAKVHAARGDETRALDTLWRAITLDPNQDNALGWYAAHHRDKQGPAAALEAFRRVAALPDSWRARLWLARHELENRRLPAAIALYDEALAQAPRPVPTDLLQQMSGDLGNHAHLPELLQLTAPYYDLATHGLPVGNNLLKAYADLGQLDTARRLLDRLYAQNRPDWKPRLSFWDNELAKARLATQQPEKPAQLEVTLLAVEGPVWLPPESPAAELFPTKADDTLMVAFLGGTAEVPVPAGQPAASTGAPVRAQLSDAAGRLSRALPLYLAEQVEFNTPALARTLVHWVVKPNPGFILGGVPWDDATSARHARAAVADDAADYLVITHLRCREEPWAVDVRLVRTIDAACLGTATVAISASDPGAAMPELSRAVLGLLATHAEIPASATPPPAGLGLAIPDDRRSHYLLRLEQLLATRTAGIDPARSSLAGERDVIEGQIALCLALPESTPARLLLAHTLLAMRRARPAILGEFRERVDLLQKEKPLAEPAQSVCARIIADAYARAAS